MYRALILFCGALTMAKGEVRAIPDPTIAKDLLRAGFIEEVKEKRATKKVTKDE